MRQERPKRKKYGFPIDIAALESLNVDKNVIYGNRHDWLAGVLRGLYSQCKAQSNACEAMIEKEQAEQKEIMRTVTLNWLRTALQSLPKNQELCIYHRYRFDGSVNSKRALKTESEVAEIVGTSQSTVYRNIKAGLKNLKKDYNANLRDTINRLKIQFTDE